MRNILSLIVLLLFTSSLWAVSEKEIPENFTITTLDNGMDILIIEDNSVPLVTIEFSVRNGASTEPPEYDGLSHLYEHMFFKSNRDYPSQEAFMNRVQELGISFNGTTSIDKVNYFVTLTKNNLIPGLEFMNSAMRYPSFDPEEMKKENPVVDAEFERAESNPMFFLRKSAWENLYGDLYSYKNTIGDHDVILTATPEKMRVIQSKYYYPNNTLLSIAGDVNAEEILPVIKKIYGDWEAADFTPSEKYPVPPFENLEESISFVEVQANAPAPIVMKNYIGPGALDELETTLAADVLSYILGQQTSAWSKALKDSGLARDVYFGYFTNKNAGPITLQVVPNPDKIEECMKAVDEQIAQMTNPSYFTDEEIQTAKDLLIIEDTYGREKTSDFVKTVSWWWCVKDMDAYLNYEKYVNAVTRKDINDYINKYITDKNSVTGILVSEEMREKYNIDRIFNIK